MIAYFPRLIYVAFRVYANKGDTNWGMNLYHFGGLQHPQHCPGKVHLRCQVSALSGRVKTPSGLVRALSHPLQPQLFFEILTIFLN